MHTSDKSKRFIIFLLVTILFVTMFSLLFWMFEHLLLALYPLHSLILPFLLSLSSLVLTGQWHPEEDRPWDQDARWRLQAAGRLLPERPGTGGSKESPDLQHSHHGLHVGAAEDEGGSSHAEGHTEVVRRWANGRSSPLQRKSGHLRQVEICRNIRLCVLLKSLH